MNKSCCHIPHHCRGLKMFLVSQYLTSCLKETQGHIFPFCYLSANKHKYLCNFQGDTQGWAGKQMGFVRLFNLSSKFSLNNISDVIRKSSNFIYGSRKLKGQIQDIAGSGQQEQPLRTSFERTVSRRGWLSHGLWVALTEIVAWRVLWVELSLYVKSWGYRERY